MNNPKTIREEAILHSALLDCSRHFAIETERNPNDEDVILTNNFLESMTSIGLVGKLVHRLDELGYSIAIK